MCVYPIKDPAHTLQTFITEHILTYNLKDTGLSDTTWLHSSCNFDSYRIMFLFKKETVCQTKALTSSH